LAGYDLAELTELLLPAHLHRNPLNLKTALNKDENQGNQDDNKGEGQRDGHERSSKKLCELNFAEFTKENDDLLLKVCEKNEL
jgi:hypothetical protein